MRLFLICLLAYLTSGTASAEFLAGTAHTDVTPKTLPVIVNGSMTSRSVDKIKTPLSARSFAFSDGKEKLVIVVVDSCMMPRPLLDEAKKMAAEKANIGMDRILISATHTHTAGSCMGALGTDSDPIYSLFLKKKLVEAILAPLKNMQPAKIGWGEIDADKYTALRRWAMHPNKVTEDPFGNLTGLANMHAGSNWDNVTGKTGPEDPMLRLISIQTDDGKPLGILANFSMHYFGDRDISADYFGLFCKALENKIAPDDDSFVAAMSHGCSGDIWRHDYEASWDRKDPKQQWTIEEYASGLADLAIEAHGKIEYESPTSIAMSETRKTLPYRTPDKQLLAWSLKIVDELGDRLPKTKEEIYAREQILLNDKQETEIVVQGLRLGENISIATTPNETYALTGLKIINASPTKHTMIIELANGGDGYIPPPEQHLLGGYNTWAARSAGLEVEAEPKIAEAAIQLLESVTEKPRTDRRPAQGSAAAKILAMEPAAYWRLDEFAGPRAVDASANGIDAIYEPKVLFHLQGPHHEAFADAGLNRAAHFAGDRLAARVPNLKSRMYAVSLWFWSGSPDGILEEPEVLFSRGHDYGSMKSGDAVGLKDIDEKRRLVYFGKGFDGFPVSEEHEIKRWTWNQLVFVRDRESAHVYLNGKRVGSFDVDDTNQPDTLFFGGSCQGTNAFHGRLDEIAVFPRIRSDKDVESLFVP